MMLINFNHTILLQNTKYQPFYLVDYTHNRVYTISNLYTFMYIESSNKYPQWNKKFIYMYIQKKFKTLLCIHTKKKKTTNNLMISATADRPRHNDDDDDHGANTCSLRPPSSSYGEATLYINLHFTSIIQWWMVHSALV